MKSYANSLKLLSIEIGAIILAFILSLSIVIFFIKRIFFVKKDAFDFRVFTYLGNYVSEANTNFMLGITWLGSQYFLIPAYVLLMFYFFFIRRNKWLGIKIAAVSLSSLIVMFSLKMLFKRPRPLMPLLKEVEGLSFPSGHAFMSFSFFGLLIYIIHKELRTRWIKYILILFLTCTMLLVGLSRIYLRVHYASDVIAGFCMGFMWMVISLTVLHFIEKDKSKLPQVNAVV